MAGPFGGMNLTDLGLIAPTSGDPIAKGDEGLLGPDAQVEELRRSIQEAKRVAAEQAPDKPGLLGPALGAVLGTVGGALAGGGQGALIGGGAGAAGGLEGRDQAAEDQLANHLNRVESANKLIEQREKLASGVRMILQSQPGLLAGEDPALIGELAFPGSGLSVNPLLKLQLENRGDAAKQQLSAYKTLLQHTDNVERKSVYLGKILDLSGIDPELKPSVQDIIDQRGNLTDKQGFDLFLNWAALTEEAKVTGVIDFEKAVPRPRPDPQRSISDETLDALDRLVAFMQSPEADGLTVIQGVEQGLSIKDQTLLQGRFDGLRGRLTVPEMFRLARDVQNDMGSLGAITGEAGVGGLDDPQGRVRANTADLIKAMEKQNETSQRRAWVGAVLAAKRTIKENNPDISDQEATKQAKAAVRARMESLGKGGLIPEGQ